MERLTTRQLPGRSERDRPSEGQLPPGTVVQGRYQIVGVLGVGGMGSVYQARDLRFPSVTKLCALKEMLNRATEPHLRKLIVENFEREANILATLDHPAVPDISDYFSEDNRSFLVMEFVGGKNLESLLEEAEEPFPADKVLIWAIQVSEVLAYLHSHKPDPIVFRDMKPSNIMLDLHDRIRVIDFGIAKAIQSKERGTMIGTEGFSPPEQYRGEAGPASDVYAWGATVHALLTNRDPRLEPPFSFAERPIRELNPDVPPAFDAIITRTLSYDAEDRYPSAIELSEALKALAQPSAAAAVSAPAASAAVAPGTVQTRTEQLVAAYQADADNAVPLWAFQCEDEIRSIPCVVGDKVVVGAYDNNLYAIDLETGEFAWKYAAEAGIASSPKHSDGIIYFGSIDERLYAVRADTGLKAWTYQAGDSIYASPTVDSGHVFFGCDDRNFCAINAKTGREAWRVDIGARIRSSAAVSEDLVYFGAEDGVVHALEMGGKPKWRFPTKRAVTSSPAVADGLVVVGSQDWSVYAIDAVNGWSAWRYRTRHSVVSSPAVHEGIVYIGSADGTMYAIDLYTGLRRWGYDVEAQITSSPLVYRDAVYFGSIDGYVYSLDIRKGGLRWRFKSEGPVPGSAVAYGDLILIGSVDGKLYALPA